MHIETKNWQRVFSNVYDYTYYYTLNFYYRAQITFQLVTVVTNVGKYIY